ncbi:hypothetical protein BDK51DRAFT_30799, partial [Blyttiomyces helicus]
MKTHTLALAAALATTSVTAQDSSTPDLSQFGIQLIGGLPGTYPATYSQQPSPSCLNVLTTSLAAASSACALSDLPNSSSLSNPLAVNFNQMVQNLEVFSAAFCTVACGNALKAYTSAVVAGCGSEQIYFAEASAVYPGDLETLINEQ